MVTNTNGTAWKYADGRLIQFGVTTVTIANSYVMHGTANFPVAFKNGEYIAIIGRESYGDTSHVLNFVAAAGPKGTKDMVVSLQCDSGSFSGDESYNLPWIVFGAWK